MKRFAVIMLVLTIVFTSIPEIGLQAAMVPEGGSNQTLAEPVLEYVYMTRPEYAPEDGQLIVISFQEENRQITDAVLTYVNAEGETAAMEVFEIIDGYVVFVAEGTGIEGSHLLAVDVTADGIVYRVNLQTFYKSDDMEAVEIEEGDEEVLEEILDMEETTADSENELQDGIEIEDLVAEDADDITEALQAAEEQVEEKGIAVPQSRAVDTSPLSSVQLQKGASGGDIVIVLDPGHGGSDPGVVRTWNGVDYIEKDINLKIAKYTKNELETYAGVTVYMTRNKDVSVGLQERVDYAESVGAAAIISQHINSTAATKQETVSGAMIFVSSGNYRPAQAKETWNIASVIMRELVNIGMDDRGLVKTLSDNGTKYRNGKLADYYAIVRYSVLANIPGMIVEHGFCNNPSDCKKYYGSNSKIKKLGVADATAIAKYYGLNKKGVGPGWNQENSKWYYLNEDGSRTYGWATISNKRYYFDSKGYRVTDWNTIEGKKYYFKENGVMVTGLKKISGKYYWLDKSGELRTGWFKGFDGNRYYTNKKGQLYGGWIEYKKKWYYFDSKTRAAAVGFQTIKGEKYYFSAKGVMKTGWQNVKNNRYYMNKSGECMTGWFKNKGKWYYFKKSNGKMLAGRWVKSKKKWYYLNKDGTMVAGKKKKIDKKWYRFDGSGVCLNK